MRFHLGMMLMVFVVAFGMHAMATAATPKTAADPAATERHDAAMRQAGETLNTEIAACREQARQHPKASQRDLKACLADARRAFRKEVRQASKPV